MNLSKKLVVVKGPELATCVVQTLNQHWVGMSWYEGQYFPAELHH